MKVEDIKNNTAQARNLFKRTLKHKFAVGAFNIDNQETLIAVTKAAKEKHSPVLVEVSQSEVDVMGLENIRDMVDNYKSQFGVEMYVNLDHSPSAEDAIKGIDAGFEFIHIDVSKDNSYEEIVKDTKAVVEYAKKTGALVESETHYFAGSSNLHTESIDYEEVKKTFTNPQEAVKFSVNTGIDTFAVSVGNLHGKYPVPKQLDIELLKKIRMSVTCYLSLHGGSGTPEHYFQEAIKVGVSKVNINSDMRVAFRRTLEKTLDQNPDQYAVIKLMPEVIEAVQKVVEEKIEMFNSKGQARP
ncbi:MAG: class II fructose-bisphosphate aldolase [Candidatus Saccharimonadales bacterium]